MSEKLKPCPFCNNKATIEKTWQDPDNELPDEYVISCSKCCAVMCGSMKEENAIKRWNTRHIEISEEKIRQVIEYHLKAYLTITVTNTVDKDKRVHDIIWDLARAIAEGLKGE